MNPRPPVTSAFLIEGAARLAVIKSVSGPDSKPRSEGSERGVSEVEKELSALPAAPRRGAMAAKGRAVFVDRDGVLNDLVYVESEGTVVSPFRAKQLHVFPFVAESVRVMREELGFQVIVISNQPGVAKRQFTLRELGRMSAKIRRALHDHGTSLDGEYYCLHHPDALAPKYRVVCDCRKPKPGRLLRAAAEHTRSRPGSYFVGVGLVEVKAGKAAGCKTVLVGNMTSSLSMMMDEEGAAPDFMVHTLRDVPALLRRQGGG